MLSVFTHDVFPFSDACWNVGPILTVATSYSPTLQMEKLRPGKISKLAQMTLLFIDRARLNPGALALRPVPMTT